MPKDVTAKVKLQVVGGQATPAPPVGPALGQHGVNPGEAVRRLNDATKKWNGTLTSVVVTVYADRTFDVEVKSPPASVLLKQAAGLAKGSPVPNKEKVGTVTVGQLKEIAKVKEADLNARDEDAAIKVLAGTARSMGIEVEGA